MEKGFSSDERPYRRGLVLGLTMAEVFILLLFALLLIWMIGIQKDRKSDQRAKELTQQVEELTRRVNELKEIVNYLAGGRDSGNQFDDLFRELKLRQEEAVALGRSAKLLQELGKQAGVPGGSPEQIAERIRERIQIAGQVIDAAKASPLSGKGNLTNQQLAEAINALVEVREGLKSAGLDAKEAAALGQSAKLLQELGKQAGIPGGSPEQIAEGIGDRVRIAGQVIDAAKTSPLSDKGNLTNQQLAETVVALAEVQEGLKSAGLNAKEAAALGHSAKLLQELGRQAGVPGASPEQIAERVRERIQTATLAEVQEALKSAGLDAKDAAILGQSAKLLQELGRQAGISGASPEETAEGIREQIRIGERVIDAAKASPLSGKEAVTNQQLAETVAALAEVQEGLKSAGLDVKEAAALGRSAKLLQELGKQAGVPGASPEQIAERVGERIQIAGKVIEAARASSLSVSRGKSDEGLAGTIAALVEAQEGLKSAGLDVKEAAALGQSAKLLQELGKQAGIPGGSPEQIAEGIGDRVRIAGQVIDAAKTSPLSDKGNLTNQQLAETVVALAEVQEGLKSAGLDAKQAPKFVRQTMDQLRDKELRLKTVEGRLRNAERVLKSAGRGTEKPACWADPETGKPEYIFDVALKSKNLRVRDNGLPDRREEQAKLPVQSIRFDVDVGLQEFRDMTRALFVWSEKEGCRFFVRVFDITQPHEKDRYKLHLRTVGEHFYYYEELNRPWKTADAKTAQ